MYRNMQILGNMQLLVKESSALIITISITSEFLKCQEYRNTF